MKLHSYDIIFLLVTGFVFTVLGIVTAFTALSFLPIFLFVVFFYYLVAWLECKR